MILNLARFRPKDEAAVRATGERLYGELLPGQPGWHGTVAGTADDGTVVVAGLWESEEALRTAADVLGQQSWWEEFLGAIEGDLAPQAFPTAEVGLGELTARAGFVQLIEGRFRDASGVLDGFRRVRPVLERHRPEIEAIVLATAEDGSFAELVLFTDEDAARAGEAAPRPDDLAAAAQEMRGMLDSELAFTDLRSPQVHLPG